MTDKNMEACLSWLQEELKLTKREEFILSCLAKGVVNIPEIAFEHDTEQFILENYKQMTIEEMSFELKKPFELIIQFLDEKGINNYKKGVNSKLTKKEKEYILKNYLTKTVRQMAEELNLMDRRSTIRGFLGNKGLKAVRAR